MKIKLALSAILIFLIVAAFWHHGRTEYRRGVNDTISANVAAGNQALTENAKIWNEVRHENSKITDLDAAGSRLGILRPDALR